MLKFLRTLALALLCVSPAVAAEDPIVSDGLTVSTYLNNVDGTNIKYHESVTNAFSTSNGSQTVTVKYSGSCCTGHSVSVGIGTKFSLTGTSATVGSLNMDGTWVVTGTPDSTHFTFTHSGTANANVSDAANTTITFSTANVDGKIRFLCNFSHLGYDDPILYPGQPGAAHLHLFFGNTATDANSTYASLRSTGMGTCDGGPLNRTAYWMPAMIDGALGKVRIPENFQWYYTNNRKDLVDFYSPTCVSEGGSGFLPDGRATACPQLAMKKIERGMKAIYGFKPSAGKYPDTYYGGDGVTIVPIYGDILAAAWTCYADNEADVGAGFYRYLSHRSDPDQGLTSDANCPSSGIIQVRVGNPNCWDGNHSASDGMNNFAPQGQDGAGNPTCPATHPHVFMSFTVIAHWRYTGGISSVNNWYLSSDRHNGANFEAGESFHWDMFWAWNDSVQAMFHTQIHGMNPDPVDPSTFIYRSAGENYVGGPYMRNTNNGGLGEECATLGVSGPCSLVAFGTLGIGISNILMDIPPLGRRGRSRIR